MRLAHIVGVAVAFLLATSLFARPVVCLDPGHPSEVGRGAQGKQISEMRAAWLAAVDLRRRLEASGVKVVMTKSREGEFVRNRRRAEIANKAKADLMLRIHLDAAPERGFATFFPNRQGKSDGVKGPSDDIISASSKIAPLFHEAVMGVLKGHLGDRGVRPESMTAVGARQGALTGSIFSEVPVLLVEMAVLTQPKDEQFIVSAKGRELMGRALLRGTLAALEALRKPAMKAD